MLDGAFLPAVSDVPQPRLVPEGEGAIDEHTGVVKPSPAE